MTNLIVDSPSFSNERPAILFVTTRLGGGGAEKHLMRISNAMVSRFSVYIAVLRPGGSYETFLHEDVSLHCVGPFLTQRWTLGSAWLGVNRLSHVISQVKPRCIISFLEPASWTTHFARRKGSLRVPHLVGIQNNFAMAIDSFRGFLRGPFKKGIEDSIQDADKVIAISQGVADGILNYFPDTDAEKIRVIHNAAFQNDPIEPPPIQRSDRRSHQLVACGRLTKQKGLEDLLQAVSLLAAQQIDIGLWILGVGPLKKQLEQITLDLKIDHRVSFVGFQKDPLPWFSSADLFVLSSWWEGFGNVIVEAMSVSTPVVSTDCPHGPREIIEHGVSGLLVPVNNPAELAAGIAAVITDPKLSQALAEKGKQRSGDFSAANIAEQYGNLLDEMIKIDV